MPVEPTTPQAPNTDPSPSLLSRRFLGVVVALGGVLLMAYMDGPVAVYALPAIQNQGDSKIDVSSLSVSDTLVVSPLFTSALEVEASYPSAEATFW